MARSTELVCVAANEDGFGPSAFAFYVVRALLRLRHFHIVLLNHDAAAFNQALYASEKRVSVVPIHSLIKLAKSGGSVDVAATQASLEDYAAQRQQYRDAVRSYLERASVAIDVGVPLFVRAAYDLGIEHRITLMDHSWAVTLRALGIDDIASAIEEDERRATDVFLFDSYLTPAPFREYWQRIAQPRILPGVLGGGVERRRALARLNRQLRGQEPIAAGQPLVLISPGGTDAWREVLPRLISDLLTLPARVRTFVPVFSAPMVSPELKEAMRASAWIRWFEPIKGSTQQVVLPAFSAIVSRAGGGIVNDALATRTPLVCVEEHQWQVELIRQALLERGFVPDVAEAAWSQFSADPLQCLLRLVRAGLEHNPPRVPRHAEQVVGAHVLRLLS